jgi:hypothetical protein
VVAGLGMEVARGLSRRWTSKKRDAPARDVHAENEELKAEIERLRAQRDAEPKKEAHHDAG